MRDEAYPALIVLGTISVLALVFYWITNDVPINATVLGIGASVVDLVTSGKRLSHGTGDPNPLLNEAIETLGRPIDLDSYALARMIRSEADDKIAARTPRAKILRALVAVNDSSNFGGSIYNTVTAGGSGFHDQEGRRYATNSDPYENDLLIAEAVIEGDYPDDTLGSTKFVNTRGGFKVPQSWFDEGYRTVAVADNPESDLVFLRKG